MSYTVMGDAVNVTSRLEGVNKDYGTQICVSQAIFREVGERLMLRPIDVVTVKGRRNNLEIYELLDVIDSDQPITESTSTQDVKEQCRITKLAYLAYANKNWPEAIRLYQALLDTNPDDHLAANMLQRCALLNK
jgi:adenylate cyclase